ncbi:hypothetical protein SUNI508_14102, partial [Seiridium unicorne]
KQAQLGGHAEAWEILRPERLLISESSCSLVRIRSSTTLLASTSRSLLLIAQAQANMSNSPRAKSLTSSRL